MEKMEHLFKEIEELKKTASKANLMFEKTLNNHIELIEKEDKNTAEELKGIFSNFKGNDIQEMQKAYSRLQNIIKRHGNNSK